VVFYSLSEEKNRGSVLELDYLTKPLKSSELLQAVERQGLSQNTGLSPKTIMIVDDDPHILNLHARVINSRLANFRVLKAHNGREALEMMQKEEPDLVLLDLMMPEIDGFEVLETMRASENLRNIPVIVLTAQILTMVDMERLQRGVTAVLSKGLFSNDEVLAQVEAALSRSKHLGSESQRVIRQAMAYIHEHYAEQVTREQLAQYVGLSERHLNRCFHEETGMPIMTYLNRYRVRQAKTLLEKGNLSISEVTLAVGFSRMNYFGRVFRQEVGISPGMYLRGKRLVHE
jgi:YesN/AraC family two-component response regulator